MENNSLEKKSEENKPKSLEQNFNQISENIKDFIETNEKDKLILSYIFYIITMSLINFDLPKNSENEILKKLIKDDANAINNDSQNNVYESGNKVN